MSKLSLDYLKNSKSSPYKSVFAIFARNEYQKDKGNVSHTHLMLRFEEKSFMNDLIRASVIDTIRVDEIDKLVEGGLMKSVHDLDDIVEDDEKILRYHCSPRCLVMTSPGVFCCRKLNNLEISSDNTKRVFKSLSNNYSSECLERLVKTVIPEPIQVIKDGYKIPSKSYNEFSSKIPYTNN